MNVETIALAAPFVVGALVLAVSLGQVRSLLALLEGDRHRQYWAAGGLLICIFLACYAATAWLVLSGQRSLLLPLMGGTALLGAAFVFLVVATGQNSIEALMRSRDELERREEEFQRLYEVTDVLNRVLRHNLRNNMNVILGRSDMLDDAVDDGEHVHAIKEEARRLVEIGEKARVIHDALDAEVATEVRPAATYLQAAVASVREEFPEASVTVEDGEGHWAEAGPLLETALENVLDNAVRHNDGRASVEVGVEADGEHVEFSVADDGPGIHPYEVEAIRDHRETPLQHGSGLGLWLASWIVDQYGGEIAFAENEPRGTVVGLRIPRADSPGAASAVATAEGPTSTGAADAAESAGEPVWD